MGQSLKKRLGLFFGESEEAGKGRERERGMIEGGGEAGGVGGVAPRRYWLLKITLQRRAAVFMYSLLGRVERAGVRLPLPLFVALFACKRGI